MPRKRLQSLVDLSRELGCEPGDYLARRLRTHVKAQRHKEAEELAIHLLPYVRHKLKNVEHTGPDGEPLSIKVVIGGAADAGD